MKSYKFKIVVGGVEIKSHDDLLFISDALYEAGCTDSHPESHGKSLHVRFDRLADSYDAAVSSAVRQIESIAKLSCASIQKS
ncbi:hypothetical protein [Vibrio sp. 10N.247.311.51]|jgi:N-acetylglucosamine-6-phosphate deacetylase|uniref:hypothetical protein n=1 Tax=Vibrio sp. 10N.247.311.51 TaxID=3229996 RepID=UPI0035518ADE